MGSFGSGRWNNYAKKRTVEDCWILNLTEIPLGDPATAPPNWRVILCRSTNHGWFPLPVHYTVLEEENTFYLDITHPVGRRGSPENVEERIELLSTRPNFGGARWYLSCPFTTEGERCGRRMSKLYLPPEDQHFGCRECHKLTYRSCQESHKFDSLYALWAGEREGETFDLIKRAYSYLLRAARGESTESQDDWLDALKSFFGEDS